MPIFHWTPSTPPIEALTTFGVSVKDAESAIGQFGTGFKYSIAGILRLGGSIRVHCREENVTYIFGSRNTAIRGKNFAVVSLIEKRGDVETGRDLGFTTDLGKHWEPWMLLRELHSNTLDEEGHSSRNAASLPASTGTLIEVRCAEYETAYAGMRETFLESRPFWTDPESGMEVHDWNDFPHFYYRGVRVGEQSFCEGVTLNFRHGITLTEDRVCAYHYSAQGDLRRALDRMPEDIARRIILQNADNRQFTIAENNPVLLRLFEDGHISIHTHLGRVAFDYIRSTRPPEIVELDPLDSEALGNAIAKARRMGYRIDPENVDVVDLPNNILGTVKDDTIQLAPRCFSLGETQLLATLLEEHFHLTTGLCDETRGFQDYLIEQIIRQYNRSR